jgi:drug/metabolite transporter (DMT)-like permease
MIFLLLSILCNSLLFIILKYFAKFKINTLQALVFNYITAFSLGVISNESGIPFSALPHMPWVWLVIVMGTLFIIVFLLIAKTAQEIGVSVATVANKMSVIIPVTVAVLFYHNSCTWLKVLGIVLALTALLLTSLKEKGTAAGPSKGLWMLLLPFIVFMGSGIIDALVNFAQERLITKEYSSLFLAGCFAVAGCIGVATVLFRFVVMKEKINPRNAIAGVILGVPNYISIHCMMKALNAKVLESSVLYPINNMGIVLLSSAGAVLLFGEKLSLKNKAGILISILAITLIALS